MLRDLTAFRRTRRPRLVAVKVDQKTTKNKKKYQVLNWKESTQALVNRGRITLWFEEESIQSWYNQRKSGKRGASNTYSESAMLCGLTLREVFHLPLRATEGLVLSLMEWRGLSLDTPDYTTFCPGRAAVVKKIWK